MIMRNFLSLLTVMLLASDTSAAPSFDCAKAQSAAEKQVCRVLDLQWNDRQLARLYKLAREQNGDAVVAGQRKFIASREACRDDIECLDAAYKARLKELAPRVNVYDAFGEFAPEGMGGSMWIVRFGRDSAFKILTIGGGGHTCTFDTDGAPQGGKGVIRYRGQGSNACRVTIAPDGDDVMVVQSKNCSDYCGMRATLDARYTRVP